MLEVDFAMRVLALDVGSKTIGLAISDEDRVVATASDVLQRQGQGKDAAAVLGRVQARDVGHVVVGLPLELDGRSGRRARAVLAFVEALREVLRANAPSVGLSTWDERFSTAAAERTLLEADVSRMKRKRVIDALAAQFILQGWLDAHTEAP